MVPDFPRWLGPVFLQMVKDGIVREASVRGLAGQGFHVGFHAGKDGDTLVAVPKSLGDDGPGGEPRDFFARFAGETERECRVLTPRHERREQVQLLRRHFGETIQPKTAEAEGRIVLQFGGGETKLTLSIAHAASYRTIPLHRTPATLVQTVSRTHAQ